mmetsp:Transcript_45749/g.128756  ORF Transcript_45749/g.128756 Transcript_45749/m.128756 type:complete len:108 (+) Transcript_45749:84-407(+)
MAIIATATRATRRSAAPGASRAYGTSLEVPTPPTGTGAVFHSRMQPPKYSLSNAKWFGIFFAMNLGAYGGNFFYLRFLMRQNPPNPPRDPENTGRPERHMHSVDDDE